MGSSLDSLASNTLARSKIAPEKLAEEVASLGARWSVDGEDLKMVLKVQPMVKAAGAVAQIAKLADDMDHHPTVTVDYHGVTLRIHTHDQKAITITDLVYAARLERWLRQNGF